VRDDLIAGGSKMRFLPQVLKAIPEERIVYASPFCGGAAVALSLTCKQLGKKAIIFYAKRTDLHIRQRMVKADGTKIKWVHPFGYMSHVSSDARKYAHRTKSFFLDMGFHTPEAERLYIRAMAEVKKKIGSPEFIWCAAGSGMLAMCLGKAFPDSQVTGVSTGLKALKESKQFPPNVRLIDSGVHLTKTSKAIAPFPCCPNYDLKAWEKMIAQPITKSTLFWNVMGI